MSTPGDVRSRGGGARRRWCDEIPAVTCEVRCGGQRHRISWRRGKLVLEDHDVLAERSLTALGSEPPLCVQVLEAWRRMRHTELLYEFLLGERIICEEEFVRRQIRRKLTEDAAARARLARLPPQAAHMLRRLRPDLPEREERMWDLTLIEALPASLREALALSVIVNVERHWHDEDYRRTHAEHIESALAARVNEAFEQSARRWRRNVRPYARFEIQTRLVTTTEQPACEVSLGTGGAAGLLTVPFSWFIEVRARGIALVDGCFILSRAGASRRDESLPVIAIRWERASQNTSRSVAAPAIVSRRPGGDWSLRWT